MLKWLGAATALGAGSTLLNACGGDGSTGTATRTATGAPTGTATGAPTGTATGAPTGTEMGGPPVTVSLGFIAATPVAVPVVVDRLGFYEKENITVEFLPIQDRASGTNALLSGSLTFFPTAIEVPATLQDQGSPEARHVIGTYLRPGFALMVHPDSPLTRGDPLTALKGLKVGDTGPNSSTHYYTVMLLKSAGLDPDNDVEFVTVGGVLTALAAWEQREVDVLVSTEPGPSTIIGRETGRIFFDARTDPSVIANIPNAGILVSRRYIDENKDVVTRFVRATNEGYKAARANPAEAANILLDYYQSQSGAVIENEQAVKDGIISDSAGWGAKVDEEGLNTWLAELQTLGLLENEYTFDDIIAKEFMPLWT